MPLWQKAYLPTNSDWQLLCSSELRNISIKFVICDVADIDRHNSYIDNAVDGLVRAPLNLL